MTRSLPLSTDVLAVGAGPAGLALGCALRASGVDHVLVDRAAAPARHSRAAIVHARTLELLALVGAADDLVACGRPGATVAVHSRDSVLLSVDFGGLDTPYPFVLGVPQEATERVLDARLRQLGGVVHRSHALVDVRRQESGVTAMVSDAEGVVHSVRARYLVGCDGLHSGVRDWSGIPFRGHTGPQTFALAEVEMDWPGALDAFTYFLSEQGTLLLSPMPNGRFRVAARVPCGSPAPDLAQVRRLLDAGGPRGAAERVRGLDVSSTWQVQYRLAEAFRAGPVFLVGDAAHVHSPVGGLGMNVGIQDALNLAWKLASVLDGTAAEALLDTYDAERRPVAEGTLAFTERVTEVTTTGSTAMRDDVLSALGSTPRFTSWLANRLAQLDIRYDGSAERVRPWPTTQARYGWSLLVAAEGVAAARAAAEHTPVLVGRADHLPQAVLVRPDGYTAATAPHAEAHRLLGRWSR
ncbi:2-polyprenyl-6-methoxyphenol hydroxylase-like FAD-dependent oxidoreductase [Saccharothrix tamanrassetensis]|uniref:2-polyprenyl-6-methoxyphenol hydroxylase-like FAD-dependent oxidoreductase n=1 Tax=Saccharothrix tamanrassetensis TaxID=1051531 RepID=A0A841CAD1_9PSEU|nr:FAD-dependent monooxygenase [Saccharothrix tamanrassetensis]MBB5954359.1 2-polyprenyl-6-methoxyphenol hydroxylase-like FAD-dependent oxidoreductase [Saccharothrix tamanrassetensis]